MLVHQKYNLKQLNTFGIDVYADYFIEFTTVNELKIALEKVGNSKHLILGGGSNILFTKNYQGWILKNNIIGIQTIYEDSSVIHIKVGAGVNWHQFVLHTIQNQWGGLENLSLIPGVVGAAPIQNIGAYGIEQKDVFISLEALHKTTLQIKTIENQECKFGYRDSIFKTSDKEQYIILNVTYQLSKNPVVNTSYGAIIDVLNQKKITTPTIKDVSNAVIQIRESKLPNPKEIGNAGSFFKNPVISKTQFEHLQSINSNAPFYLLENNEYKIPAGWLIEQCGLKGKKTGNVGIHQNQALVLVNYGNAQGNEIYELSNLVIKEVKNKFGIELEREVNII